MTSKESQNTKKRLFSYSSKWLKIRFTASPRQIFTEYNPFLIIYITACCTWTQHYQENKVFSIFPNEESQPLGHQLKHTHVRQEPLDSSPQYQLIRGILGGRVQVEVAQRVALLCFHGNELQYVYFTLKQKSRLLEWCRQNSVQSGGLSKFLADW